MYSRRHPVLRHDPTLRLAFRAVLWSFAIAVLALPSPVFAQEKIDLVGVVFNSDTQAPIEGVLVEIERTSHRVLTDTAGVFRIHGVEPGEYTFVFRKLGYVDGETQLLTIPGEPIFIAMLPQPIILEGISIQMNRLESRLRTLPYAAVALDEADLRGSGAPDAWSVLRNRVGFLETPCWSEFGGTTLYEVEYDDLLATSDEQLTLQAYQTEVDIGYGTTVVRDLVDYCVLTRGRVIRPIICIDDRTAFGIEDLMHFPIDDIYRIEVIRSGQMIRVYTSWFMESVSSGRRRLMTSISPVFC